MWDSWFHPHATGRWRYTVERGHMLCRRRNLLCNISVNTLPKHASVRGFWDALLHIWINIAMSTVMDECSAGHRWPLVTGCKWEREHLHLLEAPPAHYLPVVGGDPSETDTWIQWQTDDCVLLWDLFITSYNTKSSLLIWLVALFRMVNYGEGHLKLMTWAEKCVKIQSFFDNFFRGFPMAIIKNIIIDKYTDFKEKLIFKDC